MVDFGDGAWYDVPASEEYLTPAGGRRPEPGQVRPEGEQRPAAAGPEELRPGEPGCKSFPPLLTVPGKSGYALLIEDMIRAAHAGRVRVPHDQGDEASHRSTVTPRARATAAAPASTNKSA